MPHRDPETGQFVSDDEGHHATCYNDYVTVFFSVEAENSGGNNDDQWIEFRVDVPEMDNDELAELSHLESALVTRNDPDSATANTSPGSINAIAEMGVNLSGSEYIVDDATNRENLTITDTESSDATVRNISVGAEDGRGHLAILTSAADSTFQDTGSSTAGGGGTSVDRISRDFRAVYGEGPWLDATDELGGRIWVNKNTTDSDGRATLVGQATYFVVEDEHCRPDFGLRR